MQVRKGVYICYFKINTPIFCCFIFFEECLNHQVRIYKMLIKHTVDYHPSPSEITSGIHSFIFLWTSRGFMFPEYFLIFFSNLYISRWLKKLFQIHGVQIIGKYIYESKNWIWSLLLIPPSKTLSQVFIVATPGRSKLPISPKESFLKIYFSPAWSWKYDQN